MSIQKHPCVGCEIRANVALDTDDDAPVFLRTRPSRRVEYLNDHYIRDIFRSFGHRCWKHYRMTQYK